VQEFLDVLTKMYGLTKQVDTIVGNAFIRGISGGERKRLSIAEQMATRSSVNMWDGSTRGLDASSALDYAKSLRVQTVSGTIPCSRAHILQSDIHTNSYPLVIELGL
jgi:ABC-type multidrug transport system ATPase subunit